MSADKASRYITQLFDARCNGHWQEVPELARKVEKHAPSRPCLYTASRAGALMNNRPSSHGFEDAEKEYGQRLFELIQQDGTSPEDILDAASTRAVCLYATGNPAEALQRVPEPLHKVLPPSTGTGHEAWRAVCVVTMTLVRGLSLEQAHRYDEASDTYRPIIAYLARIIALKPLAPELRRWTEELLSHICLFYSVAKTGKPAHIGEAMAAFHQLSRLLDAQTGSLFLRLGTLTKESPQQVWKAYYDALTLVVGQGLVYHPSPVLRDHESLEHRGLLEDADYLAARNLQRTDIRRAESNYEALLMQQTKFPRAGENNDEVKEFVENVMRNWRAFCGPSWIERELEAGGKTAIGRRTLDILYRAATKTFHSTQILRHLFTLHAYLAEFDLAFKSLTSYLEILTKGKARFEKSGDAGVDLDTDDVAFTFVSETIRVACRYGSANAAEQSLHVAATLSQWLSSGSLSAEADAGSEKKLFRATHPVVNARFGSEMRALALRAIGIALATWSRYAWEPNVRADCQKAAAGHLKLALAQGLSDSQSTETLFALAVLHAETRAITDALSLVKRALRSPDEAVALANPAGVNSKDSKVGPDTARGNALRDQKMLPLWHLLAQLLSSLGEYDGAVVASEKGLEMFHKLPSTSQNSDAHSSSPVESFIDNFERQLLLDLKMTHISLLEINDSPEAAINASDDLLALYAHVYGPTRSSDDHPSVAGGLEPAPKSSSGTVRSVFHRHRHAKHQSSTATNGTSSRHTTANNGVAPEIQITNMGDLENPAKNISAERKHNTLRKAVSIRGRKSKEATNTQEEKGGLSTAEPPAPSMPTVPHNIDPEKEPPPLGYSQPPRQDTRLPVPPPVDDTAHLDTRFPQTQESRQRLSALVRVWLFVAGLYRAAGQVADAADALDEADRVVESLELDVASNEPSVRRLRERLWGSSAGVDDLWADAYAGSKYPPPTEMQMTAKMAQRGLLYEAEDNAEAATTSYENALAHIPDHPGAVAGLAGILLDSYENRNMAESDNATVVGSPVSPTKSEASALPLEYERRRAQIPETPELYLLAARDRAYGLLSSVTKSGSGWDHSESWFAYAKALEVSGQVEKAKEALWWTVELEDTRPVRHWVHVNPGGYVL